MARYTATTRLAPSRVIDAASKHFAVVSGGMKVKSKTDTSLCLEGPDGHVTISICPKDDKGKKNDVEIETSQFDAQVRAFLELL